MRNAAKRNNKQRALIVLTLAVCLCIIAVSFIAVFTNKSQQTEIPSSYVEYSSADTESSENEESSEPEAEALQEDAWLLTLVNRTHPITDITISELVEMPNGEKVDARLYPHIQELFMRAKEDGVYAIVRSGYRTQEEQQKIYDDRIKEYMANGMSEENAKKETERWVALPGYSEHQMGLSVDINADGVHSKGSDVYNWLSQNAYLYGFIQRYPANKVSITGTANEPWHYRYVGIKAAKEMHKSGECLEEYLERIQ